MRILKILLLIIFVTNLNNSSAQIIRLREVNNIRIKPISHKLNVLLMIQTTSKSLDEEYLDAQLKYYDLDLENITLHILKLADGTCKQGDTEIDFGDFKISRKELNNFIPYKLFIPVPKSNEDFILDYLKSKLNLETTNFFNSKAEIKKCFTTHESISTNKNKTSKIPQDFAIEISGDKLNFGNWNIESNDLVLKILCKKDQSILQKQQLDSFSHLIKINDLKIDSLSKIKKSEIQLLYKNCSTFDEKGILIQNLLDFKFSVNTTGYKSFTHSLGINIGYLNANNSVKLDELFEIPNQVDLNGDLFTGKYQLNNFKENTVFEIFKLGITNSFSVKLSNLATLSVIVNSGIMNIHRINSHVESGNVEYSGDYPQYKLLNFDDPTLGFGNFDLAGSRNNLFNSKSAILFFEPGFQLNYKLSEIFNNEAFSAFDVVAGCSWIISEDFISHKKSMFSNSPANGFNSSNNTLKKLYISSFTYSAGLSWKF